MAERIKVDWCNPEERRGSCRTEIMRLVELNGHTKVVCAINATRGALVGLDPYQPPDLHGLKNNLEPLGIETGHPRGITGDELEIFIGAYLSDRERWDSSLSEWGL